MGIQQGTYVKKIILSYYCNIRFIKTFLCVDMSVQKDLGNVLKLGDQGAERKASVCSGYRELTSQSCHSFEFYNLDRSGQKHQKHKIFHNLK